MTRMTRITLRCMARVVVSVRLDSGVLAALDVWRGFESRTAVVERLVVAALAERSERLDRDVERPPISRMVQPRSKARSAPGHADVEGASGVGCEHPRKLERKLPYAVVCGVCGVRLR